MKENLVCYFCGEELGGETVHSFEDRIMCESCFGEQTTTCECCGEVIWQDEASGDSNITLCNHCYEHHYNICNHCGRVISNDDAILWKALIETDLFSELKKANYEQIKISCGDILCIQSDGIVTYDEFDYMDSYMGLSWRNYSFYSDDTYYNDTYIEDLKSVAKGFGIDEDMIDTLIDEGFTVDEIEEYIYCI